MIELIYVKREYKDANFLNQILRDNFFNKIISTIKEFEDKFLILNKASIELLKENEVLIEYVDSVSCDAAIESYRFLKIKGKVIIYLKFRKSK